MCFTTRIFFPLKSFSSANHFDDFVGLGKSERKKIIEKRDSIAIESQFESNQTKENSKNTQQLKITNMKIYGFDITEIIKKMVSRQ